MKCEVALLTILGASVIKEEWGEDEIEGMTALADTPHHLAPQLPLIGLANSQQAGVIGTASFQERVMSVGNEDTEPRIAQQVGAVAAGVAVGEVDRVLHTKD